MLIKCEQIGEIEVRPFTMPVHEEGGIDPAHVETMSVYGEDLRGESQAVWIDGEDLDPAHVETIERLMEDIRKPAVVLRDFILSLR